MVTNHDDEALVPVYVSLHHNALRGWSWCFSFTTMPIYHVINVPVLACGIKLSRYSETNYCMSKYETRKVPGIG